MTTAPAVDATVTVDRYLAALNEPDPAERARRIAKAGAPGGSMTDPPLAGHGHDGIAGVGDALHQHYAGHAFRRTSVVDCHHDRLRFAWELVDASGTAAMTGMDVALLEVDGRVGQVTGFFGELGPRAETD